MTNEDKIKALAELDGVYFGNTSYDSEETWRTFEGEPCALKPYLTSYDAIIPLVKKRCAGNALLEQTFINEVERIICSGFHAARTVGFFPIAAEPEQLADALIKAVGKWKD